MDTQLVEMAKGIIEANQYMTIASCDESGNAWASTVCYAYDDDYKFYWVSFPNTKHQQNIKNNPNISFTIFDSHQDWGNGDGVQIEATAQQVSLTDLPHATKVYFSRNYPYGKNKVATAYGDGLRKLLQGKIYHFCKATPTKVWVPDPDADVDARVEVKLN
ncbi:pyridoxamine 5'-phosphate oxidase family protein [candidate division WWE3 bacterium]|uniref:Pyridoxamine 5'-phosphate oxidase family protein n=1 Tax=candidate division WWE3 bacterium TaxID=2053526 RepID=A0A955LJM0_UNCKA|nr:pyridoxamine 5'-phosphate oxidase family protein [candidate division WWE3 bacterium]